MGALVLLTLYPALLSATVLLASATTGGPAPSWPLVVVIGLALASLVALVRLGRDCEPARIEVAKEGGGLAP